jgi:hypothetical protein
MRYWELVGKLAGELAAIELEIASPDMSQFYDKKIKVDRPVQILRPSTRETLDEVWPQ